MTEASIARASAAALWWDRAASVLKALAATSGIVTFLAFGWQIYKEVRNARIEFVQAWQESEIFGIVFECRERGATMGMIETELRRRLEAADVPGGVSAASVTGPSVRRALMQLSERKIIELRPDVTYVVPLKWPASSDGASGAAGVAVVAAAVDARPYGCHCYGATPEDAETMPPDCANRLPAADGATQKSGT